MFQNKSIFFWCSHKVSLKLAKTWQVYDQELNSNSKPLNPQQDNHFLF